MIFGRNDLPLMTEFTFYKDNPDKGEAFHWPLYGCHDYYNELPELERKAILQDKNRKWDTDNLDGMVAFLH